jgi:hypothetical protein
MTIILALLIHSLSLKLLTVVDYRVIQQTLNSFRGAIDLFLKERLTEVLE